MAILPTCMMSATPAHEPRDGRPQHYESAPSPNAPVIAIPQAPGYADGDDQERARARGVQGRQRALEARPSRLGRRRRRAAATMASASSVAFGHGRVRDQQRLDRVARVVRRQSRRRGRRHDSATVIAAQAPTLLQHVAAVGVVDAVGGGADGFGEEQALTAIAVLDVAPCVMRSVHRGIVAPSWHAYVDAGQAMRHCEPRTHSAARPQD